MSAGSQILTSTNATASSSAARPLIDPEDACEICSCTLTNPCILYPCTHLVDKNCYLESFQRVRCSFSLAFSSLPDPRILGCPSCKQPVLSFLEVNTNITLTNQELYFKIRDTLRGQPPFADDYPINDRVLQHFPEYSPGFWLYPSFWGPHGLSHVCWGGQDSQRGCENGFDPLHGFEGDAAWRAEKMRTVGDLRYYMEVLEEMLERNFGSNNNTRVV